MSLGDPEAGLVQLAVKRGLIDAGRARSIAASVARLGAERALVADGGLDPAVVKALRAEQKRNSIPRAIGGYRIVSHIGNGGMSVVFRALDTAGAEVAIKLLAPRSTSDAVAASRMRREGEAAAAVRADHVVRCLASGEVNGRPWLALEFMRGGDAEALIRSGGPLPEARALAIAADCARGLAAIHAHGLVHRDVKPANIFLSGDGMAKLADFGLVRDNDAESQLTMPGMRVGTPVYMAPEQVQGETPEARDDLYGLGAALCHLLTGVPPFAGNLREVLMQVLRAPPPDPRATVPAISAACAALVMRAMAKTRAERFADAKAMLLAIEAAARGETIAPAPSTAASSRIKRWWRLLRAIGLA